MKDLVPRHVELNNLFFLGVMKLERVSVFLFCFFLGGGPLHFSVLGRVSDLPNKINKN